MTRLAVLVLSGMAATAGVISLDSDLRNALGWTPPASLQRAGYAASWSAHSDNAIGLLEKALSADEASPYAWGDLAEAFADSGNSDMARRAFLRALELGPGIPSIRMRFANFLFASGKSERALEECATILRSTEAFNDEIFSTLARLGGDAERLPRLGIGENPSAANAFLAFLIQSAKNRPEAVDPAWRWLTLHSYQNTQSGILYVNWLYQRKDYARAAAVWAATGERHEANYRISNFLYNSGFEFPLAPVAFDWSIPAVEGVRASFDQSDPAGERCLRLEFQGDSNLNFHGDSQQTWLEPGFYRIAAREDTDNLTTDEGIGVRVFDPRSPGDLDVTSASLTGTHQWIKLTFELTVPPPARLVQVEFVRRPSRQFNSRIKGVVRIDDVTLTRVR